MQEILEGQAKAIQGFANTLLNNAGDPKIAKQLLLDILNEAEDAVLFIYDAEEGDDGDKT